jgi:hypothetical protein
MAIPRFPDERIGHLPEKFFLALGHLQYAYTSLEVNLASQIKLLITDRFDPKAYRLLHAQIDAITGGMRMDVCKDTFKRLLRVMEAPPELVAHVNLIFAQISEIQYFRNRLTHYATGRWFRKRGDFINTDAGLAKEYEKSVTMRFTYDALDAARHDLHAAAFYLEQAIPDDDHGMIFEPLAWQYKPSMLVR